MMPACAEFTPAAWSPNAQRLSRTPRRAGVAEQHLHLQRRSTRQPFSAPDPLTLPGNAHEAGHDDVYLSYASLAALLRMRHAANSKRHDLAAIRASIERFGCVTPVIVIGNKVGEGHGSTRGDAHRR